MLINVRLNITQFFISVLRAKLNFNLVSYCNPTPAVQPPGLVFRVELRFEGAERHGLRVPGFRLARRSSELYIDFEG